jgi:disulfide bond formation protein DsbB
MRNSFPAARLIALLLPLVLMAGALGSQYFGGLIPCEMCEWQRYPHYAAIVLAALAFVVPGADARRTLVLLAAIAIAISGAIGVYHAGVEYGWWEGATSCSTTVTGGGSADAMLAQIMAAPLIRCDQPQWTLFGVSLAGFNALFSLGGAALVLILLGRQRRMA